MKQKKIIGKIKYENLETGVWYLVDKRYKKWRIDDIPTALKVEGLKIEALVEKIEPTFSIFMTGSSIKIVSYTLL
jgi:hypothetical protein